MAAGVGDDALESSRGTARNARCRHATPVVVELSHPAGL